MAEAGLFGIIGPNNLGGQARDYVSLGITIEELARADVSCAIICWLQATLSALMPGWGDDTVRAVYRGDALLALATSEADAGSDVSALQTRAQRDGDELIVTGRKIHVSLLPGATVMAVSARIDTGSGKDPVSLVRVPCDAPGVRIVPMPQMGMRAHQLGDVTLENVRIPASAVMGADGAGKAVMYARYNVSRCLSPLAAVGAAEDTIERTIAFAREKSIFGRKLATNQAVSFQLVEHATRLTMAKLMAYRALWMNDQGMNATCEAAMAKWFGITSGVDAIAACLQIHGANGYLEEFPLEQRLRDVNGLQFTGGTINIMKLVLVREMIGREFSGLSG